jgi:hypothetical protein
LRNSSKARAFRAIILTTVPRGEAPRARSGSYRFGRGETLSDVKQRIKGFAEPPGSVAAK